MPGLNQLCSGLMLVAMTIASADVHGRICHQPMYKQASEFAFYPVAEKFCWKNFPGPEKTITTTARTPTATVVKTVTSTITQTVHSTVDACTFTRTEEVIIVSQYNGFIYTSPVFTTSYVFNSAFTFTTFLNKRATATTPATSNVSKDWKTYSAKLKSCGHSCLSQGCKCLEHPRTKTVTVTPSKTKTTTVTHPVTTTFTTTSLTTMGTTCTHTFTNVIIADEP